MNEAHLEDLIMLINDEIAGSFRLKLTKMLRRASWRRPSDRREESHSGVSLWQGGHIA
jgi:hypothetical protein